METSLAHPVAVKAFWFGILSAVSLPLGAWVGIWTRPAERVTAGVMAFGAGALLAALTLELVGEALEKLHGVFWPLGLGCILGGLTFVTLNRILNNQGAFIRKTATLIRHVTQIKRRQASHVIDRLSRVPLLQALPPEEMHALVPHVKERQFEQGVRVVGEGDPGYELYIVEEGKLEVTQGGNIIASLGPGEVFGEMALLAGEPRQASVTACGAVRLLEIHKTDFDRMLRTNARLSEEVRQLSRSRRQHLEEMKETYSSAEWAALAKSSAEDSSFKPTATELREAVAEHHKEHGGGAPMAIWLGIFLDGIPESAVIGASLIGDAPVSMALIIGLFLANFPESMSSAVGMKKMGMSNWKITWLWASLCILTGVGAYVGNLTFQGAPVVMVALFEGLAAGAMLAMIAETMMPEAYEQGGAIVGMSTILGFLSAIFVKTIH
ncbi:cyclic nucleotide-binding domain-containing protein [bacterium]|nr:cyclic nucleotide-binding domain-containing protein [bacterium]